MLFLGCKLGQQKYDDLLTSSYPVCQFLSRVGCNIAARRRGGTRSSRSCRLGWWMHRFLRGLAAICWLVRCDRTRASAQDTKPSRFRRLRWKRLGSVRNQSQVKARRGQGRRSNRTAVQNSPAGQRCAAANAAGASRASTPVMSSSEQNVSGEDVNARRFLDLPKHLKSCRPDHHPAQRRRQANSIFAASISTTHRSRNLGRRHAGQHAHHAHGQG